MSMLACALAVGIAPHVWEQTFAVDCVSPYVAVEAIQNDYRDWSGVDVIIDDVNVDLVGATITYYIQNTDAAVVFHMADGAWDAGQIINTKGDYGIIFWNKGIPENAQELYEMTYYDSVWAPDFDVLYVTDYVPENAYLIFKGYPGDRLDLTSKE